MNQLTMAITMGFLFTAAATAHAADILVPQDHDTIQAAVTAAGDGDQIIVKAGQYDENVVVTDKPNLTIVGKGSVTIRATGTALRATGCTNLVVENVKAQGGDNGFVFENCAGVRLEKFAVKDVEFDGVYAVGGSNIRVIKGKISKCRRDGVSFADEDAGDPVAGGEMTQVKVKGAGEDGIDILGSNVTVSQCSVTRAGDDGFESDQAAPGPITFDNCKTVKAGDEGFQLFARNSTAKNCKSTRLVDDGFDVEGDDSVVQDSKSIASKSNGFEIEHAEGVTFRNLKSISPRGDGFAVIGSSDCLLDGCTAVRPRGDGFYLDAGSDGNTIKNSKSTSAKHDDLDDEGDNNTTTENNKFKTVDPNDG